MHAYHFRAYFTTIATCFAILLYSLEANAQYITHGPVVGAVTDSSVRIYVRTNIPQTMVLLLQDDTLQRSSYEIKGRRIQFTTTTDKDNSIILDIGNLKSNTYYAIKLWHPYDTFKSETKDGDKITNYKFKQDTIHGSFQTFPKPGERGDYLFVTGSCQESPNMKTFDVMAKLKPRMLIHTGDFTYPSYQMGDDYPVKYSAIEESYRRRFDEKRMKQTLQNLPIAYVPDDDDAWGASRWAGISGVGYEFQQRGKKRVLVNKLKIDSFPDIMRSNCMRGYVDFFPGYELKDSSDGFYHSFIMGNAEFIMLDTRFSGDGNGYNFKYDSIANHWSFSPDSNIHIISPKQMQWVKDKLKASKADWKFLVMGLPFNQNLKHLIDMGIKTQDVLAGDAGEKGTGFRMAVSFSTYWAGYPYQSKELLDFIKNNKINDVIVVSGDTHHNVIDDGTNGSLPELNASGLAVAGTHLAYYMNKFSKLMGYPRYDKYAWNQGGGGLNGNKNFKNQLGKIRVVGNDFVELSVVDEDNTELCTYKVTHSTKETTVKKTPHYQKKLERRFKRTKPTLWMNFAKGIAKIIFKQK